MATSGGQPGNQNGASKRVWSEAIRKAVLAEDGLKLRKLADALVDKAIAGDIPALKEVGDRMDGKSVQALEHGGMSGAAALLVTLQQKDGGA